MTFFGDYVLQRIECVAQDTLLLPGWPGDAKGLDTPVWFHTNVLEHSVPTLWERMPC